MPLSGQFDARVTLFVTCKVLYSVTLMDTVCPGANELALRRTESSSPVVELVVSAPIKMAGWFPIMIEEGGTVVELVVEGGWAK